MADGQSVDISRLIDERGITRFNIGLIIFAFFIVLVDGYDISALGFAVPELMRAWNITDRSILGPVLSASLVGMLLGAPLLGALGDRLGRKKAIIGACLIFGAFTWLTAFTTSLSQLTYLRFFAGIGIGGFMPNIIALVAEYAPRRFRATMIILMFSGVSFGDGLAWITPLLWLLFVVNLMDYFFLVSWTPLLLTSAHVPLSKAALAQTLFQLGGAAGGWAASIYPTSFRSNGAGWALGVGRFGAIVGPVLGGALIAMHISIERLFLVAAIPFAVGAVACYALTQLYVARFQASGMGQRAALDGASAKSA